MPQYFSVLDGHLESKDPVIGPVRHTVQPPVLPDLRMPMAQWGIPGPPNLIPATQFFPVVSRGHELMHRLCTMNPQFASSVLVSSKPRFVITP